MHPLWITSSDPNSESQRQRDFHRHWVAGALDAFAGHSAAVIIPLLVLSLGGSATQAGLLASASIVVSTVAEPLVGVIADRHSRRALLVSSAVVMAISSLGLVLFMLVDGAPLGLMAAVVLVDALASATYAAASGGALRQLLPADDPHRALGTMQARDQAAGMAGPAVGGILFGLARPLALLFNACAHLAAAVLAVAIRTDLSPHLAEQDERESLLASARKGLALVWRNPFLRFVVVWSAAVNAVFTAVYFAILLLAERSGSPAASIGLALGLASGCGIVGALLGPRVVPRLSARTLIVGTSALLATLVAGMAALNNLWIHAGLLGLVLLCSPALSILLQSYAIAVVPPEFQGRAGGVIGGVAGAVQFLAPLTAGLLVPVAPAWLMFLLLAAPLAVLACWSVRGAALLHAATADISSAAAMLDDDANEDGEPDGAGGPEDADSTVAERTGTVV